jgi:hypothetical protein
MVTPEQDKELKYPEEVMHLLAVQTEAYGFQDIPALSRELHPYRGGTALDIGSGEG